jgi:hypothetical protein
VLVVSVSPDGDSLVLDSPEDDVFHNPTECYFDPIFDGCSIIFEELKVASAVKESDFLIGQIVVDNMSKKLKFVYFRIVKELVFVLGHSGTQINI